MSDSVILLLAAAAALFVGGCVVAAVLRGLIDVFLWVAITIDRARANAAARRARKHRRPRGQKRPYLDERTEGWVW